MIHGSATASGHGSSESRAPHATGSVNKGGQGVGVFGLRSGFRFWDFEERRSKTYLELWDFGMYA